MFCVGADERDDDDFLVSALETVCCMNLNLGVIGREEMSEEFELRSIDRHHSYRGCWNASFTKGIDSLELIVSAGEVLV